MTLMTTAETSQRLKTIQAELKRRGAVSIGLTLAPSARSTPPNQVKADVANFFEAFLAGKGTPTHDFGDPLAVHAGA